MKKIFYKISAVILCLCLMAVPVDAAALDTEGSVNDTEDVADTISSETVADDETVGAPEEFEGSKIETGMEINVDDKTDVATETSADSPELDIPTGTEDATSGVQVLSQESDADSKTMKVNDISLVSQDSSAGEFIKAFCDRIQAAGYNCIVYGDSNMLSTYVNYNEIKKYGVWLAKWTYDLSEGYGNFENVKIWQYSNEGKINGINGYVDLNVSFMK